MLSKFFIIVTMVTSTPQLGTDLFAFNHAYERLPYHYDKEGLLMLEDVSLLEFVNSDMKNVKYQEAMANLYQIALEYNVNFRTNRYFHQYENLEDHSFLQN